jgi:pimeloyl-ACP methyl ester carboxylesterase
MDDSGREKAFGAMLLAAGAVVGAYVYTGLKTPLPGEDQDVSRGLAVERHEFVTADGITLRLKRYANPGGTPVLFCHGFQGNGFEFDLPREGHNMAVYLARRGYDTWISSFRGCGPEPYNCDCQDWQHSIDDLAIYDASALVDGVIEATGKRPFWIGHSMGGMVLYMYLQGVKYEGEWRVVSDPGLVAERNNKLRGGIAIASPPAMWWPRRHPYQITTDSSMGRGVLGTYVLWSRARSRFAPHMRVGTGIRAALGDRPRLIKAISRSPLGIMLYNRRNTDSETSTSLVKWAGDDVSARMNVQLLDGIWNKNFRQYFPFDFGDDPYDYTMNMNLISAPILFVTGDKDFANYEGIKKYGYDRVSSEIKEFAMFPDYGHTDLVMGRNVAEEVYPVIAGWMDEIDARD